MKKRAKQRTLEFRTHGGKRNGAGRKLSPGKRRSVTHHGRGKHKKEHPSHVTLRLVSGIPTLRERELYVLVEDAIRAANALAGIRIVEFTALSNHLHLVVEAENITELSRGIQGLKIRIARAINRALQRTGKVFADRFHHRDLTTPTEVRNCLAYVMLNEEHHAKAFGLRRTQVDPFSSATWFSGFSKPIDSIRLKGPSPAASPQTWLLASGWRRLGLIDPMPTRRMSVEPVSKRR